MDYFIGALSYDIVAPIFVVSFFRNEEGIFYGLEMGRTKVRVFRVQLAGKDLGVAKKELMEVPVPINLMVGTTEVRKVTYALSVDPV